MIGRLEVMTGREAGRQYPLTDTALLTAGSGFEDGIRLEDEAVGERAYVVAVRGEKLWVGGTSGVAEVGHLGRLELGGTSLRFWLTGWREPVEAETVTDQLARMGPMLLSGCRALLTLDREEAREWEEVAEIERVEAPGGVECPYLLEWPTEGKMQRRLLRSYWGMGRMVLMRSGLGMGELVTELGRRAWMKPPEGALVPLRYYDPRVLRLLLGHAPEEWRRKMFGFLAEVSTEGFSNDEMLTFNIGTGKRFVTRLR